MKPSWGIETGRQHRVSVDRWNLWETTKVGLHAYLALQYRLRKGYVLLGQHIPSLTLISPRKTTQLLSEARGDTRLNRMWPGFKELLSNFRIWAWYITSDNVRLNLWNQQKLIIEGLIYRSQKPFRIRLTKPDLRQRNLLSMPKEPKSFGTKLWSYKASL